MISTVVIKIAAALENSTINIKCITYSGANFTLYTVYHVMFLLLAVVYTFDDIYNTHSM